MYNKKQNIHFVGIGGVGMSGIAEVLHSSGYPVSGSDLGANVTTRHLEKLGIPTAVGHRPENIPDNTSVVVSSSAIPPENPELQEARSRSIAIIPRAEMLAELMRMRYGIAIAGSHGKTSTTSMVSWILRKLDPTVIIGGRVLSQASGASLGSGQYLVTEADESDGSFRLLRPAIAVVTNIDDEHRSHYGSLKAIEKAFFDFASSIPFYGLAVLCADDPKLLDFAKRLNRRTVLYGRSEQSELRARNLKSTERITSFELEVSGENFGSAHLPMPGPHMVNNALAALAIARELEVPLEDALGALKNFPGVARRTELVGEANGVLIMDDYAHHPTEISCTLDGIRRGWQERLSKSKGRLIAIFQPHRYSRTKELFHEFRSSFGACDQLIIGDIYAAGEEKDESVSAKSLVEVMNHPAVSFEEELEHCVTTLRDQLKPGDIVVTLGAGNVGKIAHALRDQLL